jgi:hypothetical protein
MISQGAYLFKVGWKDWIPLEDGLVELGLKPRPTLPPLPVADRRIHAPRASMMGKIIVHNHANLSIGHGVNISLTGVFVATEKEWFQVGETLKLTCKIKAPQGASIAFHAEALVIHKGIAHANSPMGYGLKFTTLEPDLKNNISLFFDSLKDSI